MWDFEWIIYEFLLKSISLSGGRVTRVISRRWWKSRSRTQCGLVVFLFHLVSSFWMFVNCLPDSSIHRWAGDDGIVSIAILIEGVGILRPPDGRFSIDGPRSELVLIAAFVKIICYLIELWSAGTQASRSQPLRNELIAMNANVERWRAK